LIITKKPRLTAEEGRGKKQESTPHKQQSSSLEIMIPPHIRRKNAMQFFPLNLLHPCQHQRLEHFSNPNRRVHIKF
jgi:hypothetical protein